jgi:tetratricopeptide (TPR) repeat protein
MSRPEKHLRRKHRKEKKRRHSHVTSASTGPADVELSSRFQLLSYQITPEPLRRAEEEVPGLDEALDDIRERLFDDCHNNPDAAIPELERLLERFPNAPILLNWLSAALGRAGDVAGCERVALQNFRANPEYLFARINYAQIRMEEGDLKAVDEILDKKFDLKLLYPERDIFHLSEFRAFSYLMITYWIRKGEFKPARRMFDVLEQMDPDGEITHSLRGAVEGSYLLEAARLLSTNALRRGRIPGW